MNWDEIRKIDRKEIHLLVQEARAEHLYETFLKSRNLDEWREYLEACPPSPESLAVALSLGLERYLESRGRKAANVRHGSENGSRAKQKEIRAIWASGKYSSRDLCALEECDHLQMSFSAARKALRNTPSPS